MLGAVPRVGRTSKVDLPGVNISGRAALVPLDYGTRYEHAVIFISDDWESLHALIKAPKPFFDAVRGSFTSTPNIGTTANPYFAWDFQGPVTILIEPLTVSSSSSHELLLAFAQGRPQMQKWFIPDSDIAPSDYRSAVMDFCTDDPDPIRYMAEFALETRVLTIRYVPQLAGSIRRFQNRITPATMNYVEGTSLTLLHFDMDFSQPAYDQGPSKVEPTFMCRAARKADFVMDYLEYAIDGEGRHTRVPFLQHLFGANPEQVWWQAAGSMASCGSDLSMSAPTSREAPTFKNGLDPVVVVDSVWPNVEPQATYADLNGTGDPEPEQPCVLYSLLGWDANNQPVYAPNSPYYVPGRVVVKAYSPGTE